MIQMVKYGVRLGSTIDRLLDGPEQEIWVDPWVAHLQNLGADLRMPAELVSLECDGLRITSALVRDLNSGATYPVVSDYYVCALPLNMARAVLTPTIRRAAPSLARIDELRSGWMNGLQLFLRRQIPLVRGHVGFDDSPWALTSVSQAQFWPDFDWSQYGDGTAREAFSIIISDWARPGVYVKKAAESCTKQEIYEEVLAQINAHLAPLGEKITPADIVTWFLDPDIIEPRGAPPKVDGNEEQLYITTCGAWSARPNACTEIPNLFLASEWLRNAMDFASAEGTNETARRAVNGILDTSGSQAQRCPIYLPTEPLFFAPLRALDKLLYRLCLPGLGYWGLTSLTPIVPFR
jgi:uncharacterized protein with NAD-binding domain and iron-sulfur cluster